MTTAEKILAMRDYLVTIDPEDMPEEARNFAMNLQLIQGLGFDVFDIVLPDDPEEVSVMIDKAIALLIDLRGDELPPFDVTRYGEAMA